MFGKIIKLGLELKRYIWLVIFFLTLFEILAKDSLEVYQPSSFEKFIRRFEYSKNVDNKNLIEIQYGYSIFSYPNKEVKSRLSNIFLVEIRYGFERIEDNYHLSHFPYLSSESVFLGNYSSHMSLKQWLDGGKTTDNWRFGFDYRNGLGYNLNQNSKLIFYHSGNIVWSKIDFENPGETQGEQKRFDVFDEEYKFGSSFGTGISFFPSQYLSLNCGYEHSLVFSQHLVFKWMLSSFTELATQRTIDYFAVDYINKFPKFYPIVNLIAKNAVSLLFYELRRKQMNWYFSTTEPINYDSFKIGITYIF